MSDSVGFVTQRNVVGGLLYLVISILHGYPKSGKTNHGDVVVTIATGNQRTAVETQMRQYDLKTSRFVDTRRNDFKVERFAAKGYCPTLQSGIESGFELLQAFGFTDNHTFEYRIADALKE